MGTISSLQKKRSWKEIIWEIKDQMGGNIKTSLREVCCEVTNWTEHADYYEWLTEELNGLIKEE